MSQQNTRISEATLRRLHLFSALDEAQLARVRDGMREIELARGERLFDQGEEARHFFLLRTGQIKLALLSREGEEKVVEMIGPGQFFAEAVMFMQGGRYPVTAEALADSGVLAFDNATFKALLAESPPLALKLLAAMSRRMHGLLNEIDELTLHNATYRFVTYLLARAGEQGGGAQVDLAAPKQVLASRLSIKPETLSRILARLKEEGLLREEGERLVLPDLAGLRALLES